MNICIKPRGQRSLFIAGRYEPRERNRGREAAVFAVVFPNGLNHRETIRQSQPHVGHNKMRRRAPAQIKGVFNGVCSQHICSLMTQYGSQQFTHVCVIVDDQYCRICE